MFLELWIIDQQWPGTSFQQADHILPKDWNSMIGQVEWTTESQDESMVIFLDL